MAEQPPATSPADRVAEQGEGQGEGQAAILPKIVRFVDLTRCGDELWIEHSGQLYRLRQTRQGKLILTK